MPNTLLTSSGLGALILKNKRITLKINQAPHLAFPSKNFSHGYVSELPTINKLLTFFFICSAECEVTVSIFCSPLMNKLLTCGNGVCCYRRCFLHIFLHRKWMLHKPVALGCSFLQTGCRWRGKVHLFRVWGKFCAKFS